MEFLIDVDGQDQKRTLVPDIDGCGENRGFKWVDGQGEEVALGGYHTEEEAAQAAHDAYRGWNLRWAEPKMTSKYCDCCSTTNQHIALHYDASAITKPGEDPAAVLEIFRQCYPGECGLTLAEVRGYIESLSDEEAQEITRDDEE